MPIHGRSKRRLAEEDIRKSWRTLKCHLYGRKNEGKWVGGSEVVETGQKVIGIGIRKVDGMEWRGSRLPASVGTCTQGQEGPNTYRLTRSNSRNQTSWKSWKRRTGPRRWVNESFRRNQELGNAAVEYDDKAGGLAKKEQARPQERLGWQKGGWDKRRSRGERQRDT